MSGKFDELKKKLEEEGGFPKLYLFKFIIPSDNRKLAQLQALFGEEAILDLRSSKTGKYVSLSAKEVMLSADKIVDRYEAAMKIEGCIAL